MDKASFEREVIERLVALETLIKNQDFSTVQQQASENTLKIKNIEERTKSLEDSNKWLVRLIIGAVIGGVLAFIYGIK